MSVYCTHVLVLWLVLRRVECPAEHLEVRARNSDTVSERSGTTAAKLARDSCAARSACDVADYDEHECSAANGHCTPRGGLIRSALASEADLAVRVRTCRSPCRSCVTEHLSSERALVTRVMVVEAARLRLDGLTATARRR